MSNSREFKDSIYAELARVGKAFANRRRLELLDVLAQGGRTVEALAAEVDQPLANVSQHLGVLRRARLVETEREGTHVRYRLAEPAVGELLVRLRGLGERRVAEIPRLTKAFFGETEPIDAADLMARARRGEVVLIDVRPREEYDAAHLEGAESVPLAELERWIGRRPPARPIVAYCRGPWCGMAETAVERLRSHGLDARRVELGVAEARLEGLPVVTAGAVTP